MMLTALWQACNYGMLLQKRQCILLSKFKEQQSAVLKERLQIFLVVARAVGSRFDSYRVISSRETRSYLLEAMVWLGL
eukprot:c5665_g1_i1 orf=412-645(-)